MKERGGKRASSHPNLMVTVQVAVQNPVLGKSRMSRIGHVEDAIADRHLMIPVTKEKKEVAVEVAVLVREEEATTKRLSQEAGVETEDSNKGDIRS